MRKLIYLIALVVLLGGCGQQRREIFLQQLGILGQHDLRRVEQTYGIDGNMHASFFFLGGGEISANISSERKLQFYWGRTEEEFFSTTLPYSLFRFVIDESKTIPTVEFVFEGHWLAEKMYDYPESKKVNPNLWIIMDSWRSTTVDHVGCNQCVPLRAVFVRISRRDLEKEIYLPQQ